MMTAQALKEMSTDELKAYIWQNDALQEEAILELCLRHDAPDLMRFIEQLNFRPVDVNEFIRRARARNIPERTVAMVAGRSPGNVRKIVARTADDMVASPNGVRADPSPDNTDERNLASKWELAKDLAESGMSFRRIAQQTGLSETVVRNDSTVRAARERGDPEFAAQASERNYRNTAFCDLTAAIDVIREIKVRCQHLLTPAYTLGRRDILELERVLRETLIKLEGYAHEP